MKLTNPKAVFLPQQEGLEGVYKQIEVAGRTCYKSEDRITEDSTEKFYKMLVNSGHYAMLEHGTIYLDMPITPEDAHKYSVNPYSKARVLGNRLLVTTNCRVLAENGWLYDLKYLCKPTEHHEKRYTFKLTTDRGVMIEITRHRVFSYAIESTRYCNYSKSKFNGEVTFITPSWLQNKAYSEFVSALKYAEKYYFTLLDQGWTPQEARQVLPNALKTEICMTGFESDWKHFFDLRLFGKTGAPHPDIKNLASLIKEAAEEAGIMKVVETNN